jgi:hypothetical protein
MTESMNSAMKIAIKREMKAAMKEMSRHSVRGRSRKFQRRQEPGERT